HLARLGDVPVLAELAGKVAAGGAEGKDARARIELVERLFLHRIDAEARGAAVGREHHAVVLAHAHEAHAALALVQPAVARAGVALDAAVGKAMPPARVHDYSWANFLTRYRDTRQRARRVSAGKPAFLINSDRNTFLSGSPSQTCGR